MQALPVQITPPTLKEELCELRDRHLIAAPQSHRRSLPSGSFNTAACESAYQFVDVGMREVCQHLMVESQKRQIRLRIAAANESRQVLGTLADSLTSDRCLSDSLDDPLVRSLSPSLLRRSDMSASSISPSSMARPAAVRVSGESGSCEGDDVSRSTHVDHEAALWWLSRSPASTMNGNSFRRSPEAGGKMVREANHRRLPRSPHGPSILGPNRSATPDRGSIRASFRERDTPAAKRDAKRSSRRTSRHASDTSSEVSSPDHRSPSVLKMWSPNGPLAIMKASPTKSSMSNSAGSSRSGSHTSFSTSQQMTSSEGSLGGKSARRGSGSIMRNVAIKITRPMTLLFHARKRRSASVRPAAGRAAFAAALTRSKSPSKQRHISGASTSGDASFPRPSLTPSAGDLSSPPLVRPEVIHVLGGGKTPPASPQLHVSVSPQVLSKGGIIIPSTPAGEPLRAGLPGLTAPIKYMPLLPGSLLHEAGDTGRSLDGRLAQSLDERRTPHVNLATMVGAHRAARTPVARKLFD